MVVPLDFSYQGVDAPIDRVLTTAADPTPHRLKHPIAAASG
jgi:hypothetical protein